MKVKELIEKLENLGYDDETELNIYTYSNSEDIFQIIDFTVDDEERQFDQRYNNIDMYFTLPDELFDNIADTRFANKLESLIDDISDLLIDCRRGNRP